MTFYVTAFKGRGEYGAEYEDFTFSTLDKAREFAIKLYLAGRSEGMSAYVTRAFRSNAAIFGKSIKGISVGKSKYHMYGSVVRYKGTFYWVINNERHPKYALNMDGTIVKER